MNVEKFNSDVSKLQISISSMKKTALTGKEFENAKEELARISERVEKFGVESRKNLEQLDKVLRKEVDTLQGLSVDKESFDNKVKGLKKDMSSLRNVLDSSISDVDLSEYVTKNELHKKLSKVDDTNVEVGRLSQSFSGLDENVKSLKRKSASLDDIDKIGDDVKNVSKSVDSIKAALEKVADSVQERFDQELTKTNAKFEKELAKLKSDIGKSGKAEKPGFISKLGDSFADFFKEEDLPKKEEKKEKFNVTEFIKDDKKKKKEDGLGGFFLIGVIIFLILLAGLFFYFSTREPGEEISELPAVVVGEEPEEMQKEVSVQEPVVEEEVSEEVPPVEEIIKEELPEEDVIEEELPDDPGEEVGEELPLVDADVAVPIVIEIEESCKESYECKERAPGEYWFNCYIDEKETCRCFVTDAEGCDISIAAEQPEEEEKDEDDGVNIGFYLIAAAVVLIITLLVFYALSRTEDEDEDKKEEDSVDLEEFFEKKENNKK